MESFEDDDVVLPAGAGHIEPSPVPKTKLRRLKRASSPPRRPALSPDSPVRPVPEPNPLPSPPSASVDLPASPLPLHPGETVAAATDAVGSEAMEEKGDSSGEELDPLFPDHGGSEEWRENDMAFGFKEEEEEEEEKKEKMIDEVGKEKSAKKRLNLEEEGGREEEHGVDEISDKRRKARKKKKKESEKPKESVREQRRLEKERSVRLAQLHVETQRLLRETKDASFRPVPLVQKPISSVLEKIRLRKLEVLKKYSVLHHSECADDATVSSGQMETELELHQNTKEDNKDPEVASFDSTGDHVQKPTVGVPSNESNPEKNSLLDDSINEKLRGSISPSSPSSSLRLSTDNVSSSEENDKENVVPKDYKKIMDACSEDNDARAFMDDEAEEEDDSDHDLMRFEENEEDDESDENEVLNDMIATDYKEAPIDHEKRNQLHQQWLEQQDAAATDNLLQRLKYKEKRKESASLQDEEVLEENEDSEDEDSYDLHPTDLVRKNSRIAKQMMSHMFTDDNDAYESSDDEERDRSLCRLGLLNKIGGSDFVSPTEDEKSREVFGLIRKLNIIPQPKKKAKTTSSFEMLMTKCSSSDPSKSSFLGRAASSSIQSHKQVSTSRAFIFGRDDSNSRSGLSTSETYSEDQMDDQPKRASAAKPSSSQMKSTPKQNAENDTSSSSLFEILRRSSKYFDKQTEVAARNASDITESQAAHPFSAFKLGRRFSKA